jgi:pyrroline-5-carboxylate reductase
VGYIAVSSDKEIPARTIVLVGCGQMGSAMLRGWLRGEAAGRFVIIEPADAPAGLAESPAIEWRRAPDDVAADLAPDAVVFAVKPQILDPLLPAYRRWVRPETLFLSIAAGKTVAGIARHLGNEAAIIRCMPNTPAAIGRAITVACPNAHVRQGQRRLCEQLLAAIGESAWVEDEALMDAVTAVSGSGPAYVFLLIEALAAAGISAGLPPELSLRLARATVAGSGELALVSSEAPARLRENVTSPGGTTRAALDVLMAEHGVPDLLDRAVAAATVRSRELAN